LHRVRALIAGAKRIADGADPLGKLAREQWLASSGLSANGIEAAIAHCLETQPDDVEVRELCQSVPKAPRVWVSLSSNVFIAAHRAIALALAASEHVFVRASRRDPTLANLLHAASRSTSQAPLFELVTKLEPQPSDHVYAYGSDETMEALRASLPSGTVFHEHGAGMGAVAIFADANLIQAAEGTALDTVLFDQLGCLSPRLVLLERERDVPEFVNALLHALDRFSESMPVGDARHRRLADRIWFERVASFVGKVVHARDASVAVLRQPALLVPPEGRNLTVMQSDDVLGALQGLGTALTCIGLSGTDTQRALFKAKLPRVRITTPGRMQRPAFDGPVDLRGGASGERL
jgi:hypothetical protein